jgi:hypothetical protein
MEIFRSASKPDKTSAWKTFVNSGEIIAGAVSALIAESWRKCARTGVNPADGTGRIVLQHADLKRLVDQNRVVVSLAKPSAKTSTNSPLLRLLNRLNDAAGYSSKLQHSEPPKRAHQLLRCRWQTQRRHNAIGTASTRAPAIQVTGSDTLPSHRWTSPPPPITGEDGKIVADLDLTGPPRQTPTPPPWTSRRPPSIPAVAIREKTANSPTPKTPHKPQHQYRRRQPHRPPRRRQRNQTPPAAG